MTQPSDPPFRLRFDNAFIRDLPGDPEQRNFRRQVPRACYSRVVPTPVRSPRLVAYSREMCQELGIERPTSDEAVFAEVFAGNRLIPGMDPFAMCYGGHQFGNWAGQLGDGRAINLGEVINDEGRRWVLQLKGAGPTPYSRTADGLAVLRSSLREFICSEAMHHLGVPTTRALSLVITGEPVLRDMFYDGNPRPEPGAVVCRVAPSFVRFGNFEIFASRGDIDTLRTLVDYTIRTDFPELISTEDQESQTDLYCRWFDEVCQRTAKLMVHWMRVGFVHGVMNTDNMSILGLTIDYGPYGWLEGYDADWTPNTTDSHGRRYCFGNQPQIALWNLIRLANAVAPLMKDIEPLQESLHRYSETFEAGWRHMMANKLGLDRYDERTDEGLVRGLLDIFGKTETDMTLFFRGLTESNPWQPIEVDTPNPDIPEPLGVAFYKPEEVTGGVASAVARWLVEYATRLKNANRSEASRREMMNRVNPIYVPRNYLAQLAIDAAEQGDFAPVREWLDTLRQPYTMQPGRERFAEKRPEWARHRAGCSMLSCSS